MPEGLTGTVSDETRLTLTEVELLQHLADGRTSQEASALMRMKNQTVRVWLTRIRFKLDADNTLNAVATAIRRGIIR